MSKKAYTIVSESSIFHFEEKKSQFIAQLWPATEKHELVHFLQIAKESYPDARHHCWAYLLGNPEQATAAGFNDDGEPSGTAGKPILNVLTQRKIGDVYVVVSRYFGGIKLGAGGLARAYGQAVSGALNEANLIQAIPKDPLRMMIDYAQEDDCRQILAQYSANVLHAEYGKQVTLYCEAVLENKQELITKLTNRTAGTIKFVDSV